MNILLLLSWWACEWSGCLSEHHHRMHCCWLDHWHWYRCGPFFSELEYLLVLSSVAVALSQTPEWIQERYPIQQWGWFHSIIIILVYTSTVYNANWKHITWSSNDAMWFSSTPLRPQTGLVDRRDLMSTMRCCDEAQSRSSLHGHWSDSKYSAVELSM